MAIVWLVFSSLPMVAQAPGKGGDGSSTLGSNAEGTHFMVGFMQNEIWDTPADAYQTLSIASRFPASVTIMSMEGDTYQRNIKPYEVLTVQIDPYFEVVGEGVFRKGIEIVSSRPISVYGYSSKTQTSDGYLALPISSWGLSYITANYKLDHYDRSGRWTDTIPRRGEFAVIAAEDNTIVTVYPATATLNRIARGNAYTKTLRKGDIFQVQDGGTYRGYTDITGSVVTSNKPVGLLSGHVRAAIPYIYNSRDHLIEMLPPRSAFGKRYVAVPFGGRWSGDLVRVVSSEIGNTNIAFSNASGTVNQTISALGGYVDFDLQEVTAIHADRPILVVQYSKSQGADPRNHDSVQFNDVFFDPDMVVLTPDDQFVNAAVFQTLPNIDRNNWNIPGVQKQQFENHYVTIVAERAKFTTIQLNGKPLALEPGLVTGVVPTLPEFQWATLKVSDGKIHILTGDALLSGYVYGLGNADSYAWPVGAGLRRNDVVETDPPTLEATRICGAYQVLAQDSGVTESGLARVWLDSAASSNVTFDPGVLIRGDEMALGMAALVDPTKAGHARVIAEDLAGNRDTLELSLARSLLTISMDQVIFSPAEPNQIYREIVGIKNEGDETITIDSVKLASGLPFSLDPIKVRAYDVRPTQQLQLTVYFYSTLVKSFEDTVYIWANCQRYAFPVAARMVTPDIKTRDHDFGDVRLGTERCDTIVVWNPGLGTLHIDRAELLGPAFSSLGLQFTEQIIVKSLDSVRFVVCFTPSDTGAFAGKVTFLGNVEGGAVAGLKGRGIYPRLSIGGHVFGDLQVGDSACVAIPIANIGTDTAHLTGVDLPLPAGFIPDRSFFPVALAPGDTLWLPVCFVPDTERTFLTDIIGRKSDDLIPDPQNSLSGSAYVLKATLDSCDWKLRMLSSANDSIVYIENFSSRPIEIRELWLSAGDFSDFSFVPPGLPATIEPKGKLQIDVRFVPMLPGLRSAILSARTSARGRDSVIYGLLTGFSQVPMASDNLQFDESFAYACETRPGELSIRNDGNMKLTLESVTLEASPAKNIRFNPPAPSTEILEGNALVTSFVCDFAGYEGVTSATFTWSFKEMPGQIFSRTITVSSQQQQYHISAETPARVSIGDQFGLTVEVDSAFWKGVRQEKVVLEVTYNPTIAVFDVKRWNEMASAAATSATAMWTSTASPKIDRAGKVVLEFVPLRNFEAPLDSVIFLTLPFRGFLGNHQTDTFQVTMTAGPAHCGPPALASVPYSIDSICGLQTRLFELTGDTYVLKQNTPNPFSNVTDIAFRLGMEAPTKLEIVGLDGRTMRVVVDEVMPAGEYVIPFVTDGLASGLYYYRLASGPFSAIRTMIIAK